jgi:hypothetical protein
MPRGDRTGPRGLGPLTGRATGYCAGFAIPGYANPFGMRWRRRGFGFGRGAGRGWRWRYYAGPPYQAMGYYPYQPQAAYPTDEDLRKYELQDLEREADILREELKEIEARIEEIKKLQKGKKEEKDRD